MLGRGGGEHLRNDQYLRRGHLAFHGFVRFCRFLAGFRQLSHFFCGRFTDWLRPLVAVETRTCIMQELVLGGPKAHGWVQCLRHPSRLVLPRQKAAQDEAAGRPTSAPAEPGANQVERGCSEAFTRTGPAACVHVARPTIRGTPPHSAEEGCAGCAAFVGAREVLRPTLERRECLRLFALLCNSEGVTKTRPSAVNRMLAASLAWHCSMALHEEIDQF